LLIHHQAFKPLAVQLDSGFLRPLLQLPFTTYFSSFQSFPNLHHLA